ncbi:AGAP011377-PA-like protein [Anopheles sinensis]|uniref:AGAP011377-PA-like protein n=1 Tax=Anopheles sinensis TaxID=74873 RepID=A0A084WNU7_ANOSI|nr:AGAP011377-PA-like protein [Anopheles sinensis]
MVNSPVNCLMLVIIGCTTFGFSDSQQFSCVSGPPDYLCPTDSLLQVYLQHEKFCTRYYKCVDGRAIEFQCSYGLFFDLNLSMCTSKFTLCYRANPCLQFVDACRCCVKQFDNTGLAPQNFYVCYNDGNALAQTCPLALDPCNNTTIQLEFVNQKCEQRALKKKQHQAQKNLQKNHREQNHQKAQKNHRGQDHQKDRKNHRAQDHQKAQESLRVLSHQKDREKHRGRQKAQESHQKAQENHRALSHQKGREKHRMKSHQKPQEGLQKAQESQQKTQENHRALSHQKGQEKHRVWSHQKAQESLWKARKNHRV